MRKLLSLFLAFSLAFSETVVVPIPGREPPQQPGGGGGRGGDATAIVIGALIGVGLILLLTKVGLSKTESKDTDSKAKFIIPFQFIALHREDLPSKVQTLESETIPKLNLKLSLLKWEEDFSKLRRILAGKTLLIQPNYAYELFSSPELSKFPKSHTKMETRDEPSLVILDTGAYRQVLGQALKEVKNFRPEPYKPEPHGTAVAYVALTAGAKSIALYRVCTRALCDSWSTAKALIEILRRESFRVVNMSFGTPNRDRVVELLIKLLTVKGTKVVAPIGNEADQPPPFPARLKEVISVAGSPCYPEKLCLKADVRERYEFDTPLGTVSGTSFASAYFSGKILKE